MCVFTLHVTHAQRCVCLFFRRELQEHVLELPHRGPGTTLSLQILQEGVLRSVPQSRMRKWSSPQTLTPVSRSPHVPLHHSEVTCISSRVKSVTVTHPAEGEDSSIFTSTDWLVSFRVVFFFFFFFAGTLD